MRGGGCVPQFLYLAVVAWVPAYACPEGLDECTFREDVILRFLCCLVDFTSCIVDDVFAGQSLTTVNPVLREEPAEELDARRGEVLPDEGVGGVVVVTTLRGFVDEPRHQPVPSILEEAGVFVRFQAKHDILEHLGELIKLHRCLGGQPALE